jgi:glycosyltransferase involved in cell wall biosynthesis
MRILQLKTSANVGGAETLTLELTQDLTKAGATVLTVAAERGWLVDQFAAHQMEHAVLPLASLGGVSHVPQLLKRARDFRPDVILAHGARMNVWGACVGKALNVPSVSVEHNVDDWRASSPLRNSLDRHVASVNAHRIAVSKAVATMLQRYAIIAPEKVTIIPNAVRPLASRGRNDIRRQLGIPLHWTALLSVGRLVRQKGHEFLLRALPPLMEEFPDMGLVIIGEGELKCDLVRLSEDLSIQARVIFAGSHSSASELMSAFDIFVQPSLWEGMPLAVLEAMTAGVPVVATRVGGIPEAIEHEQSGLLVNAGVPSELTEALRTLLVDKCLRERMTAARPGGGEAFDRMVSRYMEVLTKVVHIANLRKRSHQ